MVSAFTHDEFMPRSLRHDPEAAAATSDQNPSRPASRASLVEQTAEQLRRKILDGEFAPGEELPSELTLVETMGVSRTVVRGATQALRSQGLITGSQGRRARVTQPDPGHAIDSLHTLLHRSDVSVLNLIEVRLPLESEIAELAARRIADTDLQSLDEAMAELAGAQTREAVAEADMRFHRLLAEATRNQILLLIFEALSQLVVASRLREFSESHRDYVYKMHKSILDAVRRGEAEKAGSLMREHITNAAQHLSDKRLDMSLQVRALQDELKHGKRHTRGKQRDT